MADMVCLQNVFFSFQPGETAKGTTVCSKRELVGLLFNICLSYRHPHDLVLIHSPLCSFLARLNRMLLGQDPSLKSKHVSSASAQHTSLVRDSLSGAATTERRVNICCNSSVLWDFSLSDTDAKAGQENWKRLS